jgi:hypothetical protein
MCWQKMVRPATKKEVAGYLEKEQEQLDCRGHVLYVD